MDAALLSARRVRRAALVLALAALGCTEAPTGPTAFGELRFVPSYQANDDPGSLAITVDSAEVVITRHDSVPGTVVDSVVAFTPGNTLDWVIDLFQAQDSVTIDLTLLRQRTVLYRGSRGMPLANGLAGSGPPDSIPVEYVGPPPVAEIDVTPTASTLTSLGDTAAFTAVAKDAVGRTLTGVTFAWSSGDSTVAAVGATSGVATAVGDGSASVVASAYGVTGSASLTVAQKITSLAVTPATTTLDALGETLQLLATARDANDSVVRNPSVQWTSGAPAVAVVDSATGLVQSVGNGTAAIQAAAGGIAATATVTVAQSVRSVVVTPDTTTLTALGATATFHAAALDPNGHPVAGETFAWASSSPSVAAIDGATGTATAVANGVTTISATAAGVTGTANLTVGQTVAAVHVAPGAATLTALGATQQFTASVLDANGHVVPGASITWASGTPGVATIDPSSGLATAAGNGTATITATSGTVSGSATLTVGQTVASLAVSPAAATLHALGAVQQFTVIARDANDSVIPDPAVVWSSSAPGVAAVDARTGLASAVANGSATITAAAGGVSSSAALTVSQTVVSVAVAPTSVTLDALDATQTFTASALDANGHAVAGVTFTWVSAAPSIAAVNSTSGIATAVSNGATAITATGAGVSGSASVTVAQRVATVTVTPATATFHALGDTATFSASGVDANGHPVSGAVFTWSSSAPSVAGVAPATGVATALGNGTAQIVATADGVSGSAALSVQQTIASITVTPATVTLTALDAVQQFTATAHDANDSLVPTTTFLWTSGTPSVATIDPSTGIATAVGDGTTTITAAAGGASGTASLTVHQVVTSIAVTPTSATITALGATQAFTAVALDGGGQPVPGVTFTWTSGTPSVATIDPASGVATAVANGTTTITATGAGVSGSATLSVSQRVATVTVSPATAALHAFGDTADFTASGVDANGHPVPGTVFAWSSSAPSVASVDPATGVATAVGNGTAQIVATADGVSGNGALTVAQTIASVAVSPTADTLHAFGATQAFVGTARDANDSVVANAAFAWTSSAPGVATVDPSSGVATAVANGTTTITGTAGGLSATATLTVEQQAASIVVTPASATITALGATQQFAASARDANGNVVPGITFTWTSGTPNVATIDPASGLATAGTDGTTTITASGAGLSGSATLTVQQSVASVTVTPATATLGAIGAVQPFSATARDANGNVVPNAAIVWSSSAPAVASVDPSTGIATATGNGTTTITATAGGVSGTATLTVQQVIASIVVTPDSATLTIQTTTTSGSPVSAAAVLPPTQQFTATALDANGNAIAGIAFAWASSDTSVAVVDQTGLASAVAPGVTDITATSGGVTGTAVLTVQ